MKGWVAALDKLGTDVRLFAVSTDDLETQKKFAQSLSLPFLLLADEGGGASKAWGVYTRGAGVAARTTFVVGPDGKVVKVLEGADALDPAPAVDACPRRKG